MPFTLTWKQLLWIGIGTTAVGLVARLYIVTLVYTLGGDAALNSPALRWAQVLLGQVALQVGIALIAFVLVVWAIARDARDEAEPGTARRDVDAPLTGTTRPALVRVFWIGVAFMVFGVILQEWLLQWQHDLMGAVDVAGGIARDILWLVGAPLQSVALPMGVLLATGSLAVRTLAPGSIRHRVS